MPKYTNNSGLSNAIRDAIIKTNGEYDQVGWKSVTTLIDSPRAKLLYSRHADEMTEDVADLMWSFFGNLAHHVAERSAGANAMCEQRMLYKCLEKDISFKPDRVEKNPGHPVTWTLRDFKVTSVYKLKACRDGFIPKDWEHQLNLYAFMLGECGFKVTSIKLEVLGRDWRQMEKTRERNYPPQACGVFDVPIWSKERQEAYLKERVRLFKDCEKLKDNDLPDCSMDERWGKPDLYCVVRKKGKVGVNGFRTALPKAKFATNAEAIAFVEERKKSKHKPTREEANAGGLDIEFRKGESIRCERGYCKAAPWCNQYKERIKPPF